MPFLVQLSLNSIAILLFFGGFFYSRHILNKAFQELSDAHKLKLMDQASKNQGKSIAIIILMLAAYYLALDSKILETTTLVFILVCVVLVAILLRTRSGLKKLKKNEVPLPYQRKYVQSALIRAASVLVLVMLLFWQTKS